MATCCKIRKGANLQLTINNADNTMMSCLTGWYIDEDSTFIITSLHTKKEYRKKGYATKLLKRATWEAERNNIKYIELDDCSNYFHKRENIYLKHGFKYVIPGFPEMRKELASSTK